MYWIYERICLLSDRYPCPSGRDSQPQWLWDSRSFYNSNISFLLLSDSLQSFRKTIFLHPNWMLGVWWGGVSCFGHSPAAQDESAWLQVQLMGWWFDVGLHIRTSSWLQTVCLFLLIWIRSPHCSRKLQPLDAVPAWTLLKNDWTSAKGGQHSASCSLVSSQTWDSISVYHISLLWQKTTFCFLTKWKRCEAQREFSVIILHDYFCLMTQRLLAQPVGSEQTDSCRFRAEQVLHVVDGADSESERVWRRGTLSRFMSEMQDRLLSANRNKHVFNLLRHAGLVVEVV